MDDPGRRRKGRLRVYLGAAPGVGKTFAMLAEGKRRAERGTDVAVGYVEAHDRPRTAGAVGDLQVVPRRRLTYRGRSYEEMDLPAVRARRPDVALVDELAHTNIAGAEHGKRWEDVATLLADGIDVITTVNIQHLESLNDVVESITGVRQRETVPDSVVRGADAIELVDMSPQALRRRMAHGNIYTADQIDAALSRYFREGNLTALRELALLWLADRVDEGLESYRGTHDIDASWPARERVVVALTGGPETPTLLRRAARIASRTTGGEWLAVYVTRRDGLTGISPGDLARQHTMVKDLGGGFHTVVGDDVATAILDFAGAENASQILIGASRRGRISTLLRPGIGELVIADSGDIDVHIVSHDYARRGTQDLRRRSDLGRHRVIAGYLLAVVAPLLLSGALLLTEGVHGLPTESMLLMSLVVAVALVGGLFPALLAAVVSGLCLNLLFTPPVHELTIADPENALAIVVFMVVGVAVASVVDLAARRSAQARRAAAEADALAVLAHNLLRAGDDLGRLLAQARSVFGMRGAAIVRKEDERWVSEVADGDAPATPAEADADVPIDGDACLVLRGRALPAADRRLVTAYAAHAAVTRERVRARAAAARTRELAEGNRIRTALLAAVSHDLRSPLSAIKASVTSLLGDEVDWSEQDEADLLATIDESADRLNALIANLLDMSRLQTGAISPLTAAVDLREVVNRAIAPLAGTDRVALTVDERLPRAGADPGLLERVLANVCENALVHTDGPIEVRGSAFVETDGHPRVVARIIDHGPGVSPESMERLFEPFQRLGDVPRGDGVGLGLAVARGLTEAMGGRLFAEETPGGGLTFVVDLPEAARVPEQEEIDDVRPGR